MARDERNVKQVCLDYIEAHPRCGWYIAIVATLNLILNFVDAFNFF